MVSAGISVDAQEALKTAMLAKKHLEYLETNFGMVLTQLPMHYSTNKI